MQNYISIIVIILIIMILTIFLCYYIFRNNNKLLGGEFTKIINNKNKIFDGKIFSLYHLISQHKLPKNILNINYTDIGYLKILSQRYLSDSYYLNHLIIKELNPEIIISKCKFNSEFLQAAITEYDYTKLLQGLFIKSNNPTYINYDIYYLNNNFYSNNFKRIYYKIPKLIFHDVIFCHIDISYKKIYDFKKTYLDSYNKTIDFLKTCVPNKINCFRYFYDEYGNCDNIFKKYNTINIPDTKQYLDMDIFSLFIYDNYLYVIQIEHSEKGKNHKTNIIEFISIVSQYYNYTKDQLKQEIIELGYNKVKCNNFDSKIFENENLKEIIYEMIDK